MRKRKQSLTAFYRLEKDGEITTSTSYAHKSASSFINQIKETGVIFIGILAEEEIQNIESQKNNEFEKKVSMRCKKEIAEKYIEMSKHVRRLLVK